MRGEREDRKWIKQRLIWCSWTIFHITSWHIVYIFSHVRCSHVLKVWAKTLGKDAMPRLPRPCMWMLTHAVFLFLSAARRRQKRALRNEGQSMLEPWRRRDEGRWLSAWRVTVQGSRSSPLVLLHEWSFVLSSPWIAGVVCWSSRLTLAEKQRDSNWMWVRRNPREPGMCFLPTLALITW